MFTDNLQAIKEHTEGLWANLRSIQNQLDYDLAESPDVIEELQEEKKEIEKSLILLAPEFLAFIQQTQEEITAIKTGLKALARTIDLTEEDIAKVEGMSVLDFILKVDAEAQELIKFLDG